MKTKKLTFKLITKSIECELTFDESTFRVNSKEYGILLDGYYTKGYSISLNFHIISRSIEMFQESLIELVKKNIK